MQLILFKFRSKDYKCSTCGFDCHSKFCQPSPPVVVEPVTIAGTVETSVNHQAEAETASPSTTIFPTARVGALPSPADIGIPPVGPEMNGPVRAGEIENPVAPVLVRMGPVNVMTVAGTGGGSPLMVDRLIMVVLMMVLALVAKKLS